MSEQFEPTPEPEPPAVPRWRLALSRRDWQLLVLLTLLALALRLVRLDFPQWIYFDEQYYAKAAGNYLEGQQDTNTVHPPLGKLMIAYGRLWFEALKYGYGVHDLPDSIGWRLADCLAGTALIPLTYLLALVLSRGRTSVAAIAGLLVCLDFLALVTSRICMLDPFIALWILAGTLCAALFCFEERKLGYAVLAAVCFGLATAVKWNGLFAAFGALLCMLELDTEQTRGEWPRRRWVLPSLFAGVIVAIYLAAYAPFFYKEGTLGPPAWKKVVGYHQLMVRFRYNKEKFKHQYLSQFYEWPLILRPMWFYYKETGTKPDKMVRGVACVGSPVVWWAAAFLLIEAVVTSLRLRDPVAQFIVINYLANWAFWAISTTGGFFYYMLPMVPLMAVIVALCIGSWGRRLRWAYLAVVVLTFLLYFPLLTGLSVPERYFRALFFIPSWI